MRNLIRLFLFIACFTISCSSSAQSALQRSEKKLTGLFHQFDTYNTDLYYQIDSQIQREFMYILRDPASMVYPFDSLRTRIRAAISPDRRLRFISWDTRLGGTMSNVSVLAQYIDGNGKIHVKNVKDANELNYNQAVSFYEVGLIAPGHYIAIGQGKYSSQDHSYEVYNFKIERDSLVDTAEIFCVDSTCTNVIDNGYNIFQKFPASVRPIYDSVQKKLCYNQVVPDPDVLDGNNVSDRNICLFYDGRIFKRKGKQK